MQISFTKKIPISTCNIYNKKTNEFERATLYEIDCKDSEDIDYLHYLQGSDENWDFQDSIAYDAKEKYLDFKYYPQCENPDKFYALETKNSEVACLCETQPLLKDINIRYIESNPNKLYKFAGQIMLANIARLLLKTSQNLQIHSPSFEARDFYSKTCGFKQDSNGFGYELTQKDMEDFIKRIEKRTKGKILNCII